MGSEGLSNKLVMVAVAWRKDAAVHVLDAKSGMLLCGDKPINVWVVDKDEPTCRACRRAHARLTQSHPALL